MNLHEETTDFHGAEINLHNEYHTARKMMGTIGTDLDLLLEKVTHIYLNIPEESGWLVAYESLMYEIEMRNEIVATIRYDNN